MRLLLLFSAVLIIIPAYSQWEKIHPQGDLNRFLNYGRVSDDGSHWMAFGNTLGVSHDNGKTWTIQDSEVPFLAKPDLRNIDIVFINDHTGFIVYQQFIYRTKDGGKTWQTVVTLQPSNAKYPHSAYFRSIAFVSETEGYAVGDFEKILHTTDGGDHWEVISYTGTTTPFIAYSDVSIRNNTLYISGYRVDDILMNFGFEEFVMTSTDRGKNWSKTSFPTGADFRQVNVHHIDNETWFAQLSRTQSSDELYFTADNGLHWEERSPAQMRLLKVLECLSNGVMLSWGEDHQYRNAMYRSADFGKSWSEVQLPVFPQQDDDAITDIIFEDNLKGFAVGAGGNVLTTDDGGITWTATNTAYPQFFSFEMVNDQLGFASAGPGFFKTEDGGSTWQFMDESESLTIMDMIFESPDKGIFFGWKNFYYDVSQRGSNTTRLNLPVNFVSLSSVVTKGDSIFAGGAAIAPTRNIFMRSGDRGGTWLTREIPMTGFVSQIRRSGQYIYYVAAEELVRSGTNGEGWERLSTFGQDYLYAFLAIDDDTYLGYFGSGQVKRTSDSGRTWHAVGDFSNAMVKDFLRVGDVVFVYGSEIRNDASFGMISRSTNFGVTWQKEILPLCDNLINDMDAVGNTIYATGGYGQFYRHELEEVITAGDEPVDVRVEVYPNPAREVLMIESNSGLSGYCMLVDMAGRTSSIKPVVMEHGRWTFPLKNIPSGVYILQGETLSGTFRKRIVITP